MTNEEKQQISKSIKEGVKASVPFNTSQRETDVLKQQIVTDLKAFAKSTGEISKSIPIVREVVGLFSDVKSGILSFINGLKRTWEFSKSIGLLISKGLGFSRNRTMKEVEEERYTAEKEKSKAKGISQSGKKDTLSPKLEEFAERGLRPGSIYTHDIHSESKLDTTNLQLENILNSVSAIKRVIGIFAVIRGIFSYFKNREQDKLPLKTYNTLTSINDELKGINARLDELIVLQGNQLSQDSSQELQRIKERRMDLIRQREAEEEAEQNKKLGVFGSAKETLSRTTKSLWGSMKDMLGKFKDFLLWMGGSLFTVFITNIKKVFGGIWKLTKGTFKLIGSLFVNTFKAIWWTIKTTFKAIGSVVNISMKGIRSIFDFIFGKKGVLKKVFDVLGKIGNYIGGIAGKSGTLVKIGSSFKGLAKFMGVFGKIFVPITIAMTAFEVITGVIKGWQEGGLVGAIKGGVQGLFEGLIGNIFNLFKDILAWFIEILGFENLSKKLKQFDINKAYKKYLDFVFELPQKIFRWVGDLVKKVHYEITHWGMKWESSDEYARLMNERSKEGNAAKAKANKDAPYLDKSTGEFKPVKKREDSKLKLLENGITFLKGMSTGISDLAKEIGKSVTETVDDASTFGVTAGEGFGETGSSSEAMNFFQNRGWTKEQASGIVGNLQAESGGNLRTNAVGDGGKAYGIAQWHPDRQRKFRQVMGKDIRKSNFNEQLEFVNWELNNSEAEAGRQLRAARTAQESATVVDKTYERSAGLHRRKRVANALALMGSKPTTPSVVPNLPETYAGADLNMERRLNGMYQMQTWNRNNSNIGTVRGGANVFTPTTNNSVINNTNAGTTVVVPSLSPFRNTLDDYRFQSLNGDMQFSS